MEFSEERIQLLNVIRQMIEVELDRRKISSGKERPMSEHDKEPDDKVSKTGEHPDMSPSLSKALDEHRTLWQRIMRLFSA